MPTRFIIALAVLTAAIVASTAELSAAPDPGPDRDMDIRELMQRNPYPQDPCDRVPPPTKC